MTADAQAVIAVNREYPGMTPVGLKFSSLADRSAVEDKHLDS